MYNDYYDEYMKNILEYGDYTNQRGLYSMMPQDLYNMNTYMMDDMKETQKINNSLEDYYPDIYKNIYPFVQNACRKCTNPITKNTIEDIVNEIYKKVEPNDSININVNVGNTSKINNYRVDRDIKVTDTIRNQEIKTESRELKGETRNKETKQHNYLLNDLIRILVLRELIEKPIKPSSNFPPQRPPMRPPYYYPEKRPPIIPRGYYDYYGIYE